MSYAEVAVNVPLAQTRTFSYAIPPDIVVGAGHAVWVPFGARVVQGIVLNISSYAPVEDTRPVASLIDPSPLLSSHQIELCRWMAEHYLCSYFDAAALMLPPGFERRLNTFIEPVSAPDDAAASLTPDQARFLASIRKKGRVELRRLRKLAGAGKTDAIVAQLLNRGLVKKTHELERVRVSAKTIAHVAPAADSAQLIKAIEVLEKRGAGRQARLLDLLLREGHPMALPDIRKDLAISSRALQTLAGRGLITIEEKTVQRDPLADRPFPPASPPVLFADQARAWLAIRAEMDRTGTSPESRIFLLHGVTGSGKTEVYLRALTHAISLGKKAIVLVPEIALTAQTVKVLSSRFPRRVAVLHSGLSLGEQFDAWHRIKSGGCDVVIGSRGALFAPQPDLGLIVLDEEHEWTYKQHDQSPRYHARDVAVKLANLTGSVLLLGSATPDMVSFHQARKGEYRLLKLSQRISSGRASLLPVVEIVDLRRELKEGNRSVFSRSLLRSISSSLDAGEQVILFLNRRGTATFVQCRDCGHVLSCRRCDVSLTYHSAGDDLVCHRCNHRTHIPELCPECRSKRIKFLGMGTQKLEQEVAAAFPGVRTLRWDRDATRAKGAHDRTMELFLAHGADILVGTQMIAKGLDMPLVTLVGVMNADIGLYLPDYQSSERTFQLLAQVAGRAGRRENRGRVVIQTYTPGHYAITAAAQHDYPAFYEKEITFRQQQGDPPFRRLASLIYAHTGESQCGKEVERVFELLGQRRNERGLADTDLIGPCPAFARRLRGRYRWQIIVRSPEPLQLLADLSLPSGWSLDIDPVSLL
ncbi:MAG: primosomal protein N' [Dehalococcoidia bacterium]|nr:primosomal protein N' [Dehalococcoidia bacterium]